MAAERGGALRAAAASAIPAAAGDVAEWLKATVC